MAKPKFHKPDHYDANIDPIALMETTFSQEMLEGFFAGNVIKYTARAHLTGNQKRDLEKAADYLDRLRRIV